MESIESGQVWKIYDDNGGESATVGVVETQDDGTIILRPQGTLELIFVTRDEMLNKPDRFRKLAAEPC